MSEFSIVLIAIWACAAVGTAFLKKSEPFYAAFWATVVMGFCYVLTHG